MKPMWNYYIIGKIIDFAYICVGVGRIGLSLNKANELILRKRARAKESLKIMQMETTKRDKADTSKAQAISDVTESPNMHKGITLLYNN